MDAQQFNQFLAAEQAARAAQRNAAQQEHQERQQLLLEEQERSIAEAQIKQIQTCDGQTARQVREWIRDIEISIPYSNRTVYIASQAASGSLKREIEAFLDAQPNRNNVQWGQVRQHIQNTFLSQHEDEVLRDDVRKLRQLGYESAASYSRRFRDAAAIAYPVANRNADQQRSLLSAFYKGLKDRTIVERLIKEGRPANFEAAILLVAAYESDNYRIQKAMKDDISNVREEEPMEIGVVQAAAMPPKEDPIRQEMAELKRQVGGMSKQITKLIASKEQAQVQVQPVQQNWPRRPAYRYAPDGDPICYKCNKKGHKGFQCFPRESGRGRGYNPSNQRPFHQKGGW